MTPTKATLENRLSKLEAAINTLATSQAVLQCDMGNFSRDVAKRLSWVEDCAVARQIAERILDAHGKASVGGEIRWANGGRA